MTARGEDTRVNAEINETQSDMFMPPLLDGADAADEAFAQDSKSLIDVSRDGTRSRSQRIRSFEELIDLEIGDTNFSRIRNFERNFELRQIFVKFEGGNPTGTQKDRIAFAQALDALRRGYDAVTLATCGNYGVAMATAAYMAGLRCIIHIPEEYHTKRMAEMEAMGAIIVRNDGDYEESIINSRMQAEREDIYDANPGGANTALQLKAYGEIAHELFDELRDAPAMVAVPVSNGTTLAGIYSGFLSLYRRGKTSRIPKMIAGSAFHQNPIVLGFLANLEHCEDLKPERIKETAVNEPLVNWHSQDGDHALHALRTSNGWAAHVSDKRMKYLSKLLREQEGLHVLPASTAGLHAFLAYKEKNTLPGDRYVIILTGRKA